MTARNADPARPAGRRDVVLRIALRSIPAPEPYL
ncbi:hypothetical protein P3T27_007982 [Kitasatospora sp. MAA19]|nr:hypothetical protein [Kitasatospora sp. MAA19]